MNQIKLLRKTNERTHPAQLRNRTTESGVDALRRTTESGVDALRRTTATGGRTLRKSPSYRLFLEVRE
jgi:hypothetical protein